MPLRVEADQGGTAEFFAPDICQGRFFVNQGGYTPSSPVYQISPISQEAFL